MSFDIIETVIVDRAFGLAVVNINGRSLLVDVVIDPNEVGKTIVFADYLLISDE